MTTSTIEQSLVMNRKAVVALVGLSYTTIYNLEKQGKFPARRQLSPGRVAWVRSEVMAWLEGITHVGSGDKRGAFSPVVNTPEPHKIIVKKTYLEKSISTTHSKFEPLPWLRSSS